MSDATPAGGASQSAQATHERARELDAVLSENDRLRRENAQLEHANRAVWRENARLARDRLGRADAAAATELTRTGRRTAAEARSAELVAEVEHLRLLLATPRHRAVERARTRAMRSRPVYWVVRRLWALLARGG
jgi:hypothetical protein